MQLSQLVEWLSISCDFQYDVEIAGFKIDSRHIKPGQVFVAFHGESQDGHDYIKDAEKNGASALMVTRRVNSKVPQIIVKDPYQALVVCATKYRETWSKCIVAVISGSNGKTTTKEILASMCRLHGPTFSSYKNYNSQIGLPLMVLNVKPVHQFVILELGISERGKMHRLTQIAKPHISVLTNIGRAHLERLESLDGVASEKANVYSALSPSGVAIIPADCDYCDYFNMVSMHCSTRTYGRFADADIKGVVDHMRADGCCEISIRCQNSAWKSTLNLVGKHQLDNVLAAVSVAEAMGVAQSAIEQSIKALRPLEMRMQVIQGVQGATLIADCYNANPSSFKVAIDACQLMQGSKRYMVMGQMGELADHDHVLHNQVIDYAKEHQIDAIFCCGEQMAYVTNQYENYCQYFEQIDDLIRALKRKVTPKTLVLIKGSRMMKMENIVAALKHTQDQLEACC